jgi:hypothetical protein
MRSASSGLRAVLVAFSVSFATIVFLPGVLVRVGAQRIAGQMLGADVEHYGFSQSVGGEVEPRDRSRSPYLALFFATMLVPLVVGAALLLPAIVRYSLLDVRPFSSVSTDPSSIIGTSTPVRPLMDLVGRVGRVGSLRIWVGVSCLYSTVPSASLSEGARAELRSGRHGKVSRMLLGTPIAAVRLLLQIDNALMLGLAGAYFASGLLVTLVVWIGTSEVLRAIVL